MLEPRVRKNQLENAKNFETLEQYSMALTDYVSEIEISSNEKFDAS